MAQVAETTDQPGTDRGQGIERWRRLRRVGSSYANDLAAAGTIRWPGDGPRPAREQHDPGLVWIAGLPEERASAALTMRDLLSTWRSAERLLKALPEGGEDWALVQEQIASLRAAHRRLFIQISRGLIAR